MTGDIHNRIIDDFIKETYKEHMASLISKGHDWYAHKKDLPASYDDADKQAPMETKEIM